MNRFNDNNPDEIRADMFNISSKKWKPLEKEGRKWIQENWERWEEEKPEWFTEVWKSRIPDDWLSRGELKRQTINGGGQRRRSSLGELMGGNVMNNRRGRSSTVVPVNESASSG